MKRYLAIAMAIACFPSVARAQLDQMRSGPDARYGIELARGFYEGDGLAWYTSTLRGRMLAPISPSARLLVDVGLSLAGVDDGGADGTFANPELGLVFVDEAGESRGHLTVVLPIGFELGDDDVSTGSGFLTDFFRPDRWADDLVSVNAGVTPRAALGDATELTSELTAAAMIPTADNGDAELFARYALGLRHRTPALRLSGSIEGFAIVSQGDLSLGERTLHRLLLAIDGTNGGPGLFVRVPLDEDLEGIDAVLGLTFAF